VGVATGAQRAHKLQAAWVASALTAAESFTAMTAKGIRARIIERTKALM
jgi:hypothetical protein